MPTIDSIPPEEDWEMDSESVITVLIDRWNVNEELAGEALQIGSDDCDNLADRATLISGIIPSL